MAENRYGLLLAIPTNTTKDRWLVPTPLLSEIEARVIVQGLAVHVSSLATIGTINFVGQEAWRRVDIAERRDF